MNILSIIEDRMLGSPVAMTIEKRDLHSLGDVQELSPNNIIVKQTSTGDMRQSQADRPLGQRERRGAAHIAALARTGDAESARMALALGRGGVLRQKALSVTSFAQIASR
jgi:hypothetical protein